jgi:uncharacterized membrane protein
MAAWRFIMSASEYRRQAREALKVNYGYAIAACILASIVSLAVAAVSSGILSLVVAGPIGCGLAAFFACLFRDKKADLGNLIAPVKKNAGDVIVAGLLQNLFIALWSLLFVIPGIVKAYSYAMTFYILNDNPGMSATDAIKQSRSMMNGHKLDLFLLHLSFIGWILLSVLTFGILAIFLEPYIKAANFAFYENLKKQPQVV